MAGEQGAIVELTHEFVRCRACWQREDLRQNLTKEWTPPRGWAGKGDEIRRDVMLVSLNPGALMTRERRILSASGLVLKGRAPLPEYTTNAHARLLLQTCTSHYERLDGGRDSVFHKKSLAYARLALAFLDGGKGPGNRGALERCWFTDAYKCSTRRESGPAIKQRGWELCREHLVKELRFFRPKLVLALGQKASEALMPALRKLQASGVSPPPCVRVRHPSNGCLALPHDQHDRSLQEIWRALHPGVPGENASWSDLRHAIQVDLFGEKKRPIRPSA